MDQEFSGLRARLEEGVETPLRERDDRIASLEASLGEREQTLLELQARTQEHETGVEGLRGELEQSQGTIGDLTAQLESRGQAIGRLEAAGIAYGRLSSLDDLARHPQNRYRDAVDENGAFRLLAPGALIDGEQPAVLRVPALGEHDDSLRAEFAAGGGDA